jgi:hypothetical protein
VRAAALSKLGSLGVAEDPLANVVKRKRRCREARGGKSGLADGPFGDERRAHPAGGETEQVRGADRRDRVEIVEVLRRDAAKDLLAELHVNSDDVDFGSAHGLTDLSARLDDLLPEVVARVGHEDHGLAEVDAIGGRFFEQRDNLIVAVIEDRAPFGVRLVQTGHVPLGVVHVA